MDTHWKKQPVLFWHHIAGNGVRVCRADNSVWDSDRAGRSLELRDSAGTVVKRYAAANDMRTGMPFVWDGSERLISWDPVGSYAVGSVLAWSGGNAQLIDCQVPQAIINMYTIPGGRFLSWCADGSMRMVSCNGAVLAHMDQHAAKILGIDSDSRRILSWDSTGVLVLWDMDGICLARIQGHEDVILGAIIQSDGTLLSWSEDETIRQWSSSGIQLAVRAIDLDVYNTVSNRPHQTLGKRAVLDVGGYVSRLRASQALFAAGDIAILLRHVRGWHSVAMQGDYLFFMSSTGRSTVEGFPSTVSCAERAGRCTGILSRLCQGADCEMHVCVRSLLGAELSMHLGYRLSPYIQSIEVTGYSVYEHLCGLMLDMTPRLLRISEIIVANVDNLYGIKADVLQICNSPQLKHVRGTRCCISDVQVDGCPNLQNVCLDGITRYQVAQT